MLLASCGASQSARSDSLRASDSPGPIADAGPTVPEPADAALPARAGRLWRRDVVAVLSRGLGDFLTHLQVEPALSAGKFRGWRVLGFRAGDPLWQGTDLAAGDIVTAVNGRPIERPEQAFAAFQSLAVAQELRIAYERNSVRRELVYPIDDR